MLFRTTSQEVNTKFDFEISDWNSSGLLTKSFIRLHKSATLESSLIEKVLGRLNDADLQRLKAEIIKLLNQTFD